MRMVNAIAAAAALCAATARAGDSAPFALDTSTPSTPPAVDSLTVAWDASWIGGDADAEVVIADNGLEIKRATGAGEFAYTPSGIGRHELTYTTYVGGVAQSEVYRAMAYSRWKYEVVDGGAVVAEASQKSGAVAVPSEIDGYPVTGIASGAFSGCGGLTAFVPGNPSVPSGAFSGVPVVYVSDAYVGSMWSNMRRASSLLSILPSEDCVLDAPVKVSAECGWSDLELRCTTDGSAPTAKSPLFSPFMAKGAVTVRVGAFLGDVPVVEKAARFWEGAVARPAFAVVGGSTTFTGPQSRRVTISCVTEGATVRYTLDGSEPTESSLAYSGPIDFALAVDETVTVRAKAFRTGWRPSVEAYSVALTRRWGLGDSVGAPDLPFTMNGEWLRSQHGHDEDEALQSGSVADGGSCWFQTTVMGGGAVSFWWRTSCEKTTDEEYPWDHVAFTVDGVRVAWLDGETDWQQVVCRIEGDGEHVLRWAYSKDSSDSAGQDCAWVSQFAWDDSDSYTIAFHRNDASDGKEDVYDFDYGVRTRLPSLNSLGWARRGFDFNGWSTSVANAAKGAVWKGDWAIVSTAAPVGETLDVYASWALKDGCYAIYFVRNDGAGTWRTVGFDYGEKTRMPSLANGLGWARRGFDFMGWALTTADATAGNAWKGDWAYVATPVKAGETLTVYASWRLKPGYYQIRYNKNDGSGKWRALGFECGVSTKLNSIAALGWEIPGKSFRGWGSNAANAAAGKVWKTDGALVKDATAEGKTLSIYAIWE